MQTDAPSPPMTLARRLEDASGLDAAVDRLEPVVAGAARGRAGDILLGRWLGHAAHPLLSDLPIGCWTAAGLLDLFGGRSTHRAAQRLVGLGVAFVPITAATGWAEWSAASDRRVKRVGVVHAAGNTAAVVLYVASWRARRRGHHLRGAVLGLVGGGLAGFTGYLGGHMAFVRGAGHGARDTSPEPPVPAEHELIDARQAAELLNVDLAQIEAMVEADLLVPVSGSGADATFEPADVLAARLVGG